MKKSVGPNVSLMRQPISTVSHANTMDKNMPIRRCKTSGAVKQIVECLEFTTNAAAKCSKQQAA